MPQGVDSHPSGKQDRVSEPRLQCPVDERDGVRNDDLSAGVHVPRHPPPTDVHEVGKFSLCARVIADNLFS